MLAHGAPAQAGQLGELLEANLRRDVEVPERPREAQDLSLAARETLVRVSHRMADRPAAPQPPSDPEAGQQGEHLSRGAVVGEEGEGRGILADDRRHRRRHARPEVLEALPEGLGARVTPTMPTVIRKDSATLSFLADDGAARQVFTLLDGLRVGWRLRGRRAIRHPVAHADEGLTGRQREVLSLAWTLGYFDIPAKVGLEKLAELTGLSRNTVSQHLRRGLRRILRESLP